MIRSWRDLRRKTDIFAIGAMARRGRRRRRPASTSATIVQLAQLGTILSLFRYSREMEAEADAMGARLLAAGRLPADRNGEHLGAVDRRGGGQRRAIAASAATAAIDLFATHPAPEARMADLKARRAEVTVPGKRL